MGKTGSRTHADPALTLVPEFGPQMCGNQDRVRQTVLQAAILLPHLHLGVRPVSGGRPQPAEPTASHSSKKEPELSDRVVQDEGRGERLRQEDIWDEGHNIPFPGREEF